MSRTNVDNIKAVFQLATLTEQQDGVSWYPAARAIATNLAKRYSIPAAHAVGVTAALSPRHRRERDVHRWSA